MSKIFTIHNIMYQCRRYYVKGTMMKRAQGKETFFAVPIIFLQKRDMAEEWVTEWVTRTK